MMSNANTNFHSSGNSVFKEQSQAFVEYRELWDSAPKDHLSGRSDMLCHECSFRASEITKRMGR